MRQLAAAFPRPACWLCGTTSLERRASSSAESGSKLPHSRASPTLVARGLGRCLAVEVTAPVLPTGYARLLAYLRAVSGVLLFESEFSFCHGRELSYAAVTRQV